MNRNSINRQVLKTSLVAAVLATLLLLSMSPDALAIEAVSKSAGLSSLEVDGSYFMGRRAEFRNLYSGGLAIGLWYQKSLSHKTNWGVRASFTSFGEEHGYTVGTGDGVYDFKYRDISFAPTVTYSLVNTGSVGVFAGAGIGLSIRTITIAYLETDNEYDDSQVSPYGILLAGANINLSRSTFFGARVSYDRHFFSDAETGGFGDSGGFNFGGGIGFTF